MKTQQTTNKIFVAGPWKFEPETRTIRTEKENYWVASMNSWEGSVNHEANARRIVECVNACEGIADPKAVPDLLEAAEIAMKVWPDHLRGSLLEQAINKARGGA